MKTRRYISLYSLWAATLMLLLSVMVTHHHHLSEICVAMEQCAIDGNVNDSHTAHHDSEDVGCVVQQMHHFTTNGKHISSVRLSLIPCLMASAMLTEESFLCFSDDVSGLPDIADTSLSEEARDVRQLRAPPCL